MNHVQIRLIITPPHEVYIGGQADKVRQASPPSVGTRREIMKFAIRAGLVALSIANIPPAFAGESGPNPNMSFAQLPGVIAEAPAQNAPVAPTQRGQELRADTQSGRGPWLFPPIGKYLDQQARG
jgi:hypothetical protein